MNSKNYILSFFFSLMILITTYQSSNAQGILRLKFEPVFEGKPLVLNDKKYLTSVGDSVSIEEFNVYVSSIRLKDERIAFNEKNSYHLIKAEDSSSLMVEIKDVKDGTYQALKFDIGVDSASNVAGALGGALDPSLGMYWSWNTGYINAKLTGHSPSCNTPHNAFEFHIGGYILPFTTLRSVTLPLNKMPIDAKHITTLTISFDAASWFNQIHLITMNKVVQPSLEAMRMADNYMDMFKVTNITISDQ